MKGSGASPTSPSGRGVGTYLSCPYLGNFDHGKKSTAFGKGSWDPRGGRAQRCVDDGLPAREGVRSAVRSGNRGGAPAAAESPGSKTGNSKMVEDGSVKGPGIRERGPLSGAATTDCQQGQGCGGRSAPQPAAAPPPRRKPQAEKRIFRE